MKQRIIALCAISLLISILSCKSDEPTAPQNHLPKIESLTANPNTVLINTETTLTCIATDEDGDNITVTWTAKRGSFPNGVVGISVKWIAPSTAGKDTINVTLNDGKQTAQANLEIVIGTISPSPALLTPNNNASEIDLSPTLTWSIANNADNYTLQVSTSNLFSSFVFNQSGITNTSQQISGLKPSTTYYWRVSAQNNFGSSNWSNEWSFTTIYVPCSGLPTVLYNGKTYNTVQIGAQCWLKENLDVGTMIQVNQNPSNNSTIEKYCYDNKTENCDKYGGLYQWNEAMAYSTTPGTKGICPTGWHIPTLTEFNTLSTTVSGNSNALKALGQGSGSGAGTNSSGFSALLAGYRNYSGFFSYLGNFTYFWSSTETSSSNAYDMRLWFSDGSIYVSHSYKNNGYSVRCVKD